MCSKLIFRTVLCFYSWIFLFVTPRPSHAASTCPRTDDEEENERLFTKTLGPSDFEKPIEESSCKLFLAESSILNAGLGVYTAVDIYDGDGAVSIGPPDVALAIFDWELHNDYFRSTSVPSNHLWKDYVWSRTKLDSLMMNETQRASILVPGLGMMANGHLGLHNIAIASKTSIKSVSAHSAAELSMSRHDWGGIPLDSPGSGAFTPYYNIQHVVVPRQTAPKQHDETRKSKILIKRGSELFHDYGQAWFEKRQEAIGTVPFGRHYDMADNILQNLQQIAEYIRSAQTQVDADLLAHIWELILTGNSTESEIDAILRGPSAESLLSHVKPLILQCRFDKADSEQIRMALPDQVEDAVQAAKLGSARFSLPNSIRSPQWLMRNGLCLDKLFVGPSKISHGGRGAFAARFLEKDEVIAPIPLLHIHNKSLMDMYVLRPGGAYGQPRKLSNYKETKQLLLNYAYGHDSSSLLLFPYSPAVNFVNHDLERPNAKQRWASHAHHKSEWLNKSVEELAEERHAGLLMELVATQSIQPGEEITISYGLKWQEAWNQHMDQWSRRMAAKDSIHPPGSGLYTSSMFLAGAFRQEIAVPDDLWPDAWKNKK